MSSAGGTRHDIVVLGAGVAGLAAARTLSRSGAQVAVLEARDRVGGRIWTQHASLPVELGAEFIHGLPAESWDLLREANLTACERDGAQLQYGEGALRPAVHEPGGFEVITQMQQWFARQPAGTDLSFEQYLALAAPPEEQARRARRYVEGFNAADAARISVASLVAQQVAEDAAQGSRIFHVRQGYDALPRYLAQEVQRAGGQLLTGHTVRRVDWRRGQVVLTGLDSAGRSFETHAGQAVITLPLGVLQAGEVQFAPRPDAVLAAAARLAMGAALRVSFIFKTPLWRDRGLPGVGPDAQRALDRMSFLFSPGELPGVWWTWMPDPAPVITAWVGGSQAQGGQSWVARSEEVLAKILGMSVSGLQRQMLSSHYHDWQADPFSRGAYSYVPVGALECSGQMSEPVERTLFFAGEHTDQGADWGTVHAALRSGLRAAAQALRV